MPILEYAESDSFYEQLDYAMKHSEPIVIRFAREKLDRNAKLWPRLRRCPNWADVERSLQEIADGNRQDVGFARLLTQNTVAGLTGGEIALFAWAASLLSAVFMYSIYKGRRISVRVRQTPPEIVLAVE